MASASQCLRPQAAASTKDVADDLSELALERKRSNSNPPPPNGVVMQARRRLSVSSAPGAKLHKLDGANKAVKEPAELKSEANKKNAQGSFVGGYATLSRVGYVPFNPAKVNQDRALEMMPYAGAEQKAVFGVMDGHGTVGHEVSQFVCTELPQYIIRQPNLESQAKLACTKAFLDCNAALCKTSIDSAFSGTTCVVCYMNGTQLVCCNTGDSRAVLGQRTANGQLKAFTLSVDHKPDMPVEKKRILENRGRVEACKGSQGEDIGPPRVWLQSQDVPGLAMSRSFGDQVAASVGVIAKPEIVEHTMDDNDCFIIIASDGVWEFIPSQEAVDLISNCDTPEAACQVLQEEATRRWQKEEEVIDDITAIVIFLKPYCEPVPADVVAAAAAAAAASAH